MNKIKELEVAINVFEKQLKEKHKRDIITRITIAVIAFLLCTYIFIT